MTLKSTLLQQAKTRWIDLGCGGNYEEGFYLVDTIATKIIPNKVRDRYIEADILDTSNPAFRSIGKFDLVRMQHVLEHFTFEEGQLVLANCADLLDPEGMLLITVPDLQVHISKYLGRKYQGWGGFKAWATNRIPLDAPDSFFFSMFAHSVENESHKWCYDFDGLAYQLQISGRFKNIQRIQISDPLASVPFTHNRPEEDLCILARKL